MQPRSIRIVNARQHNLRGVNVEIPRRRLTVVTGPSGSGKSSLAFDTLYAEGQRRYIESLSSYAKQFLERMPRPLVDTIEGIAPAVAIEQRSTATSLRSTVGTATEIHDYLRLLYSRVGVQLCVSCGNEVRRDTVEGATEKTLDAEGKIQVVWPLKQSEEIPPALLIENLRGMGFVRVLVDGQSIRVDDSALATALGAAKKVQVVVDRLVATEKDRARISEALSTAFSEGDGRAQVVLESGEELRFTESPACSACDTAAPRLTPSLFSFNNPRGACSNCNGFGATLDYDLSLIVPDESKSLREGAIDPWTKPRYGTQRRRLLDTAQKLGADPDAPWIALSEDHKQEILNGKVGRFVGIIPFLTALEKKRYKQYIRVFLRQYQLSNRCDECDGTRLNKEARAVTVAGVGLGEVTAMQISSLGDWLTALTLNEARSKTATQILQQLDSRLGYLNEIGLGYLTLDRQSRTLSGGESQRIALGNALGSQLVDSLYVLDEPSVGLHPRDTGRLLTVLDRLRDQGNTVVVVEHDTETIQRADWMVELGPGAGKNGGELVYSGPLAEAKGTLTTDYLSGLKKIAVPSHRRNVSGASLRIAGAQLHNVGDVDFKIPFGAMTAVTGVSGSGKSTIVHDILVPNLRRLLEGSDNVKRHLGEVTGQVDSIEGWQHIDSVVVMDQSPIGKSPRSNPVTYIKAFDEIRALFARQPLSKQRKYTAGTFSFNTAGGRCSECDGAGHIAVEMVFLADVYLPCEVCGGSRYSRAVLDVRINGVTIADVLDWSVDQAVERFHHQPKLGASLWQLQQVGLGYLQLGQPATTLSGGEAQRLKIARELMRGQKKKGRKLYLLDEPTTGLHTADVRVLIGVLDKLVDAGNTVVVIEHNLDVIKRADWIIDMGPEGGPAGGRVVAMGTPEEVVRVAGSHTGKALNTVISSVEIEGSQSSAASP